MSLYVMNPSAFEIRPHWQLTPIATHHSHSKSEDGIVVCLGCCENRVNLIGYYRARSKVCQENFAEKVDTISGM